MSERDPNLIERVALAFSRLRAERQRALRAQQEEAYGALEQQEIEMMEKAMQEGQMPDDPSLMDRLRRIGSSDIEARRQRTPFGAEKRRRMLDEHIDGH